MALSISLRLRLATLAAILATVPVAPAAGQDPALFDRWRASRFGLEAGLPANHVTGVAETTDGTVWAGTTAGLAWFDGFNWHPAGPPRRLPTSRGAFPYSAGTRVTVALDSLLVFGDTVSLRTYAIRDTAGVPWAVLDAAPVNHADVLVLAFRRDSLRLLRVRPAEDSLLTGTDVAAPLPRSHVGTHLVRTRSGRVVLTGRRGLVAWADGQWETLIPTPGPAVLDAFDEDPSGSGMAYLRFPASLEGLWTWEPGRPAMRISREGTNTAVALVATSPTMAVYETGHVRVRSGEAWSTHQPAPPEFRDAEFLYRRQNGDLWLGTRNGLHLLRVSSTRWRGSEFRFPDQRNRVHALLRSADGSLWTGTAGGLVIHRPDGSTETIDRIGPERVLVVTALAQDEDGGIWAGSGSGMDAVWRWNGTRWQRFGSAQGLASPRVHRIVRGRGGHLWFLGLSRPPGAEGPVISVWDGQRLSPWEPSRELSDRGVYAMDEAPDGTLWVGTTRGLSRWNGSTWTHLPVAPGFDPTRVFDLAIDRAGTVWFTNRETGLYALTSNSLMHHTDRSGLQDNRVWEIHLDAADSLWVTSAGGLNLWRNGEWSGFGAEDGLPSSHLWPVLPEADRVVVGTLGHGVYELSRQEEREPGPRVQVEVRTLGDGDVHLAWRPAAWWGSQTSERILTRWRLDAGPWSPWSLDREVTIHRPGSGRHVAEVEAKGLFGYRPHQGTRVAFRMPRPILLQPQVLGPLVVLAAALLGVLLWAAARKRKSERELRALEAQLRQAQKMEAIGQLAGGIAHDFNNVLTAIIGTADLLAEELPDSARRDLDEIRHTARRGAAMVRRLLIFSRRRELGMTTVRLAPLVHELAAGMLARLLPENIQLSLPPEDLPVAAQADRSALEQILLNLATNARDAMPSGGILQVEVRQREVALSLATSQGVAPGTFAGLEVRDNGTGMDELTRSRAFDPFFTTKEPGQGTGLGLAMVYGLVRQHQGFVELESTPGRGTTVRLWIPHAKTPEHPRAIPGHGVRKTGTETILLVEDEDAVRDAATRILARAGYRVLPAANGEEALALLAAGPARGIALIVTDVVMPILGGFDLFRAVRGRGSELPFIFVSGHAGWGEHQSMVPPDPDVPFLQKPWEIRELLDLVRDTIDAHQAANHP